MTGEIAQAILDGLLSEDGELIDGDEPGYPRSILGSQHRRRINAQAAVSAVLPYPCPGCARSFKHKGNLRAHRRDKAH